MPPRIQSLRWRRFVAKYVTYLEIFAYGMVLVVGGGLIVAWTYKVDVVADSKEGDLKPYEHEINAAKDCLVVRLPVANKTDVRKGDVVARVCAEPDWIKRYQAMAEVRTALEQMQAMAASVTATSQERAVMESLAGGLAVWDAAAEPTLEPIVAPADGTLWLGSCTTGTRVAADKKLCVVKDFNILRAKLAFETSNAFACRPGLPGWVEVNTEQKDETLVRLNTDTLPYVPYFGSRLGLFSSIAADDIRSAVTKDLKGKGLLDRDRANTNDFPLPADSFAGITVFVDGRPRETQAQASALESEDFRVGRFPALLVDGEQSADLTLLKVGDAAAKTIRDLVDANLAGRPVIVDGEHITIEKSEDLVVNVEVSAKLVEEEWPWREKPHGIPTDQLPDVSERAKGDKGSKHVKSKKRKYTGNVQIVDPEPHLRAYVKQLILDGKSLKVKAKIVTKRTPFAMMLFRKH